MYDTNLRDFLSIGQETDDSPRIQRAIDSTPNGVLYIPKGDYYISTTLHIKNRCSIRMHPAARLIAKEKMDFVLNYDGCGDYHALTVFNEDGTVYDNLGLFIEGGDIDGKGIASCLHITNAHHFTLSNIALHNGAQYGLCVGKDDGHIYELICNNVYCKCTMTGISGNIGIYSDRSDCHFNDCIIVDYTIGIQLWGSSNRLSRCHIWGGTVAPVGMSMREWSEIYGRRKRKLVANLYSYSALGSDVTNEPPSMLPMSIAFDMQGSYNVLDGCYADTAEIGYKIGDTTRLIACDFFNNGLMGLKKSTAINHVEGSLFVIGCAFRGPVGTEVLYEGKCDEVFWLANSVEGGDGMCVPDFSNIPPYHISGAGR